MCSLSARGEHSSVDGAPDSWSESRGFDTRLEWQENFFSRVNFLCWLLVGIRSTPVLPQWHVKYRGHSVKSAGVRLHLNTQTPLTQRSWSRLIMLSRRNVGTYQGNALTRNSSGNARSLSSQLAEDRFWRKSGISSRELISTLKKNTKNKKNCRRGMIR